MLSVFVRHCFSLSTRLCFRRISTSQRRLSDFSEEGILFEQETETNTNRASGTKQTPAMAQYFKVKEQVPGYLLLFRLGDFYEMFFEDAVRASKLLDIVLTARDKNPNVPMCGVPAHSVDTYIERLVKKGVMVAVCDQIESISAARQQKRIIRREITRLVTPGTLIDDRFLQPRQHNFLAALHFDQHSNEVGLACMDLSTGHFFTSSIDLSTLNAELTRLMPSEVLIASNELQERLLEIPALNNSHRTERPPEDFNFDSSVNELHAVFDSARLSALRMSQVR